VLTGLPSVSDLAIDDEDNIYVAGFGKGRRRITIGYVPKGERRFIPLKRGLHAWCVCLDPAGNVYYSTGRTLDSVRVLKRKGARD